MKDQLTATLFGLVVVGTAILAGSQSAPHARGAEPAAAEHRIDDSVRVEREAWEHKRLTYGGA
jgi:hypothetical protein